MEILGYLASVGIGVILGLLGGGGSILSIPILVYMFHIDAVRASAYSLFIVGVTSSDLPVHSGPMITTFFICGETFFSIEVI